MRSLPTYSVFSQIAQHRDAVAKNVSQSAYDQWKKIYTWQAVQHSISYGESFCNHFELKDYILLCTRDADRADVYIQEYYIK
jgi:hypothetical protein